MHIARTHLMVLPLASLLLTGCVTVSLHSTRPVEVRVTDQKTEKPVSGALVETWYGYTGYGVFYVLRVPKAASARTDERGVATIPIADFFQNTVFKVNGERYGLTSDLIRHGGSPRGGYWAGVDRDHMLYHPPPYVVQLTPKK